MSFWEDPIGNVFPWVPMGVGATVAYNRLKSNADISPKAWLQNNVPGMGMRQEAISAGLASSIDTTSKYNQLIENYGLQQRYGSIPASNARSAIYCIVSSIVKTILKPSLAG